MACQWHWDGSQWILDSHTCPSGEPSCPAPPLPPPGKEPGATAETPCVDSNDPEWTGMGTISRGSARSGGVIASVSFRARRRPKKTIAGRARQRR